MTLVVFANWIEEQIATEQDYEAMAQMDNIDRMFNNPEPVQWVCNRDCGFCVDAPSSECPILCSPKKPYAIDIDFDVPLVELEQQIDWRLAEEGLEDCHCIGCYPEGWVG